MKSIRGKQMPIQISWNYEQPSSPEDWWLPRRLVRVLSVEAARKKGSTGNAEIMPSVTLLRNS